MNQKNQSKEPELSQHVIDALGRFQDDDYIIIKPALRNLQKQNLSTITAQKIMETLQLAINQQFADKGIIVLKVEFRTQLADEDYASKLISEPNFNNFQKNKFLMNLLENCIFDLEGESFMNQQNDEDDDDEGVFSFQSMLEEEEEIRDITLIDASKQRNKIHKLQEINQMVEKLEKALNKISKLDIQLYDLKEAPLDSKLDSPLTVTLRMQKKHLVNFLKFHFPIASNSEPVYINFRNAQIIEDNLQYQEYSVKMGKIPFTLNELTFSYVTGEHLKDKLPDQPIHSPINLFLSPYFKFSDLQSQLQLIQFR